MKGSLFSLVVICLMPLYLFSGEDSKLSVITDEYPQKLIADGRSWVNSALKSGDKNIGTGYMTMAKGFALRGNEDSAINYLQKAIHEFVKTNNRVNIAEAKLQLADIFISMSRYQQSTDIYISILEYGKEFKDTTYIVLAYNGLGLIFRNFLEYAKAHEYLDKALELSTRNKNARCLSAVYKNLGTYYFYLNNLPNAKVYYTKALKYWNDKGMTEEKCGLVNNLGNTYRDQGELNLAIEHYKSALTMSEKLGSVYLHTVTLKNLGSVSFKLKKYNEAFILLNKALVEAKRYRLPRIQKEVLKQEALLNAELGNYKGSIEKFLQFEKLQDSLLKENQYDDIIQSINTVEQEKNQIRLMELERNIEVNRLTTTRNYLFIAVLFLILTIAFIIVIHNYLSKIKITRALEKQRDEIREQKEQLQNLNFSLQHNNEEAELLVRERTYELQRINELLREEIEERKTAVQSLHDSQEYLIALLNSVADPIFIKDNDHKWVMVNDAAVKIFGLPRENLLGKSDYDVFPEEEARVFWEKDDEVLTNGIDNINEELITSFQGSTHLIETKKKLFINKSGEKFIVGIISDITEQRTLQKQILELNQNLENKILERTHQLQQLINNLESEIEKRKSIEKELVQQKEKAEESSRLKTNFLSNMSHEIRTPLTGILGYAELLDEEIADPPRSDMTQKIVLSGKRLLSTLDAVLLLSHLQSEQIKPVFSNTDLATVIKIVISRFRKQSQEKNIPLIYQSSEPVSLKTDSSLLTEVLNQLIDNALKFSHQGEIQIIVMNAEYESIPGCRIDISDNGIGLLEDQMEYIFDDFRQGSEGWGRSFEGNGLGLSIARRIVLLLRGRIWAEKNEIQGSVFKIWLPLKA